MFRNRRLSLWLPVILWATAIATATSIPGSALPRAPFRHTDLFVHVGLYGVFAFLLYRAVSMGTRLGAGATAWLMAFLVVLAYGILDEIHQLRIPGRYCSFWDMIANGVGAAVGSVVCMLWVAKKIRSEDR
jgi:VanZ family protein